MGNRIAVSGLAAVLARMEEALQRGQLALSPETYQAVTSRLQGLYPELCFALVSSGTAALQAAYTVLGVRRVIVPAVTFYATATAALASGAEVLLVGTTESGCMDPEVLRELPACTTDAVAYVHLGGWVDPVYGAVAEICRGKGWKLIEDASHAIGTQVGRWADAVTFSFYASKVVTCGEGGAVGFRSDALAQQARSWADHGRMQTGAREPAILGTNSRLTEMQGLVLEAQLQHLPATVWERRAVIESYLRPEMVGWFQERGIRSYGHRSGNGYKFVLCKAGLDGEAVSVRAQVQGVRLDTSIYRVPLHHMEALASSVRAPRYSSAQTSALQRAEAWCREHVALPCWPGITEDEVVTVLQFLKEAF